MPSGIYKRVPLSEKTKGKISLANKGKKRTKEMIEKMSGENNHGWKGDEVGRIAIHDWLKANYGCANKCENRENHILDFPCTCANPKQYDWANMNDHVYRRVREDFKMLCRSCHTTYDFPSKNKKRNSKGQFI